MAKTEKGHGNGVIVRCLCPKIMDFQKT